MWRWLHSLPRGSVAALRQQIHGPRASAGVCVEEDPNGKDGVSTTEAEAVCQERQSWKTHCTCFSNNEKTGGSNRDKDSEKINFWNLVHGPHTPLEAIGWGGAIVLGIQLTKFKRFYENQRTLWENEPKGFLYSVVRAMSKDDGVGIKQSVLPTHTKHRGKAQTEPSGDLLEKAALDFSRVCQKYMATGKCVLGVQHASEGNMQHAVSLWQEASSLGHAKAHFNLALCYETGNGVQKNLLEALRYYKLAGEAKHPRALYNMALLYMEGSGGVLKDTTYAVELMENAAALGLTQAQVYLGVYYTEDESRDLEKAVKYFSMAADQNDPTGEYYLGVCYEQGAGVEENQCKAAHLYGRAAHKGHSEALYNLAVFHTYGLGGLPINTGHAETLLKRSASADQQTSQGQADLWTDEIQKPEESQQNGVLLRMNSSVSSPVLTELVREHISRQGPEVLQNPVSSSGTVSQIYTQLLTPRGYTLGPSVVPVRMASVTSEDSDSDSGVVFSLGADEADIDALESFSDYSVSPTDSRPTSTTVSQASCVLPGRHSSMPDIQALSCI